MLNFIGQGKFMSEIDFDYAEQYQIAFIKAIVSSCQFMTTEGEKPDRRGIDLSVSYCKEDQGSGDFEEGKVEFQLKTTTAKPNYKQGELNYPLKVGNYRKLIKKSAIPKYLVVMPIPDDTEQWIKELEDGNLLVGKCYWINLVGQKPTKNKNTITVTIPLANQLTKLTLSQMLTLSAEGKSL